MPDFSKLCPFFRNNPFAHFYLLTELFSQLRVCNVTNFTLPKKWTFTGFLQIWLPLCRKSLIENLILCEVNSQFCWHLKAEISVHFIYYIFVILYVYINNARNIFEQTKCTSWIIPKKAGGVNLTSRCRFSKHASSKERVTPCFFVNFNIITSHISLGKFIKTPQIFEKIYRVSLSILAFSTNFVDFVTFPCYKETKDTNL